jgi:hypothetical protein
MVNLPTDLLLSSLTLSILADDSRLVCHVYVRHIVLQYGVLWDKQTKLIDVGAA